MMRPGGRSIVGTGTDVAIESADVVMMSDDLTVVMHSLSSDHKYPKFILGSLQYGVDLGGRLLYPFWGITCHQC